MSCENFYDILNGTIKLCITVCKRRPRKSNNPKSCMLEKLRFRTDIGRYLFTNRVVNDWNRLGTHVVSAESKVALKDGWIRVWIGMTDGMAKYWIIPRVGFLGDMELPCVGH